MDRDDWKRRAEAAERTADVLKRKVVALYDGHEKTIIQRQLERAEKRSLVIAKRRELSELRTAELERYSARLEDDVAQRTRTIRTILDNVLSGFLLVDKELVVAEGSSQSCKTLLQTSPIAGRGLIDLLRLSPRDAAILSIGFEQLFEDGLAEELLLDQLPSRFVVGERGLLVQGRAVRDEAGVLRHVLLTITDVTALDAAERDARTHRMLLGILRQRTAFLTFVHDTEELIDAAAGALDDQTFVRRAVHTIKGNASGFDLFELVDVIHAEEQATTLGVPELDRIGAALRAFLDRHRDVLDIVPGANQLFAIPAERALEFREVADRSTIPMAVRRWCAEISLKPLRDMLGPLSGLVTRLADRLGKLATLELEGETILVDAVAFGPVVSILPHLVRNAVDHGIELPDHRGDKPMEGRLVIRAFDEPSAWRLEIEDDGSGLDGDRLVERVVELGILAPAAAATLSPEERLDLAFRDRVSTATRVTDVSGRGVGLAAVRSAVRHVGGSVTVQSTRGQGTVFTIRVPKIDALRGDTP